MERKADFVSTIHVKYQNETKDTCRVSLTVPNDTGSYRTVMSTAAGCHWPPYHNRWNLRLLSIASLELAASPQRHANSCLKGKIFPHQLCHLCALWSSKMQKITCLMGAVSSCSRNMRATTPGGFPNAPQPKADKTAVWHPDSTAACTIAAILSSMFRFCPACWYSRSSVSSGFLMAGHESIVTLNGSSRNGYPSFSVPLNTVTLGDTRQAVQSIG